MLRLVLLVLVLLILVVGPFVIWAEDIETIFADQGVAGWMRGYGGWAWLVGIGLIASDIVLPVPATAVMSGIGIIYGPLTGGVICAAGSMLAGILGYGLCRMIGPERAQRIAGEDGFAQARALFARSGGWTVAGSRWLPVLPEMVSFLAGLTGMSARRYLAALACGSVPLGFVFATAGHIGADNPIATMLLSALAPLALWALVRPFLATAG